MEGVGFIDDGRFSMIFSSPYKLCMYPGKQINSVPLATQKTLGILQVSGELDMTYKILSPI